MTDGRLRRAAAMVKALGHEQAVAFVHPDSRDELLAEDDELAELVEDGVVELRGDAEMEPGDIAIGGSGDG